MHKNSLWLLFLCCMALLTLWFVGLTGHKAYRYWVMSEQAEPTSVEWEVKNISGSKYGIKAEYTFSVRNKQFTGETVLKDMLYLNPWAAEAARDSMAERGWTVWYHPNKPAKMSTLDREFPFKMCIYAGVVFLLFLYFVGLGIYVRKF